MHKTPKYKKAAIPILLFALLTGSLWYLLASPGSAGPGSGTSGNDSNIIFAATGVTETGLDPVVLPIVPGENIALCVEEIYISAGDTVTAGEKCIRFTDDSIARARARLEDAVQSADLACRSKVISNGEGSIQARYAHELALLEAEFAPGNYQDTLTQLEMQLARAESAYQKALEEYNAYYSAVENNTFYDDFRIEQLRKASDDAYDLYDSRRKYLELTEEEQDRLSAAGREDYQWILRTLALLKEEASEAKDEYELARQNYQQEIEGAEFTLHRLLNKLESAEQDLADAQIASQKEGLHAKTVYELTVAKGQLADNNYRACLDSLASELCRLDEAKSDALRNKAVFDQLFADGCLCANTPGTIAVIPVRKGQTLTGGDTALVYDDPEKVFVSVPVPAEAATELSVGDQADVTVTDCGRFYGVIETIQPAVFSGSQAAADNTVTVSLKGDIHALTPGLTATVAFRASSAHETSGLISQMYDLNLSDPDGAPGTKYLEIAEVYVAAGQHIRKGDPVCRFTQESIENVRKALACAQSEAMTGLLKAQINYHTGVLAAALSHNEALLDMTLAQTVYDNTIARLNSGTVAKILETEQLLTEICQLQLSLTDDQHQRQQSEITKAYNSAKQQTEKARESFVTRQVEAAKAFQAARDSYEALIGQSAMTSLQIADKAERIYTLQDEIFQSQQFMEKALAAAEQARISSQTAGETAHAQYADCVKRYGDALSRAQAELDTATRKLDALNQFTGDGTVYAAENGLVAEIGYAKGDFLSDAGKLVYYVAETAGKQP